FGNAEVERGQVFFEGNRYRVTRGSVSFSNPTAIQPVFDVEVETDIRVPGQTYRVTLGLNGSWGGSAAPELEFSSDPPLQQFEIVGLLLGDLRDPQQAEIRTLRAREASQQELLQAAGARLITNPVSSGVGEVVERSFGVDTFEIVPSLDDPTTSESIVLVPTARVLIGKRISERAHVTFSRALSGANQDLIMILEYDATDRLSWVVSQNEDQTYALDFRVRHAF
ncbi:MAG: translocation/assembly module TamB domain-containing protein, partial [Acidobacteria bacterium]|nr:translocation/assembly module TamB domain-containing protein [Acidobacteriota bacterium]